MSEESQKQVVYNAIVAFLQENGLSLENNRAELTKSDRKTIVTMIATALDSGDMPFSATARAKHDTPTKIRNYSTGLLSNWLRKDNRINGGAKHKIKNPGSKANQDDEVLKDLKSIRKLLSNKKEIQAVDNEIALRMKQLNTETK
jgi:hypothetical protein